MKREQISKVRFSPTTIPVVKTADKKFFLIPIVYILLRVWGTVRFFQYVVKGADYDMTDTLNLAIAILQVSKVINFVKLT